jgi:hypothetical protein
MNKRDQANQYGAEETAQRREAALKRMLSTPHQPHKPIGKTKAPVAERGRDSSAKRKKR